MPLRDGFTGKLVILTDHINDLLPARVATKFAVAGDPQSRDAASGSDRSLRQVIWTRLFDLSNGRVLDALVPRRRQRDDQVYNPPPYFRVANSQKRAIELKAFSRGEEVHDVGLRRLFRKTRLCRIRRRAFKEIAWRDFEHAGGMLKTTGADAV